MNDYIIIDGRKFKTIIALTEEEQQQGLMYKKWMPPIMSFPSDRPIIRKFWMLNTPSPLDIIYACDNKVIDICNGVPFSLNFVGPNEPSDLVVEMPKGFANRFHIKNGSRIELNYSIKTLAKKHSDKISKWAGISRT